MPSAYHRTCTECGKPLRDKRAKTCTPACRAKRSRRLKKARAEGGAMHALESHQKAVQQIVRNETPDIAHDVIEKELAPIVREAITDDVLSAIRTMMGLAPTVVQKLAEDIDSHDPTTRQKAYDLWLRYTVGRKEFTMGDSDDARVINVNFELPRPGDNPSEVQEHEAVLDAVELRSCDICHQEKPSTEFMANSDRCQLCQDQLVEKVRERFDLDDEGGAG